MAASSEIEKLERRYAENPDGRYFAPLADAYRKAGQVDRALEVVRAGLEKHPDYLSAHIVFGRCLLDRKEDEGAGQAFERVLALDAENIIALKSLSEIAERRSQLFQARQWLQKLLQVDPMNADAAADLERLGGAIASTPTAPMEAMAAPVEAAPSAELSFADVAPPEAAAPAEAVAEAVPEAGVAAGAEAGAAAAVEAGAAAAVEAGAEPPPPGEHAFEQPPEEVPAPADAAQQGLVSVQFQPPTEEVPPPALEMKPFDESLAWGTGERASRTISQKDIEAALHDSNRLVDDPQQTMREMAQAAAESAHDAGGPVLHGLAAAGAPLGLGSAPAEVDEVASRQTEPVRLESAAVEPRVPEPWPAAPAEPEPAPFPASGADAEREASLSNLPIIMPEDVTPPEEMARPSGKLKQALNEALPERPPVALGGVPGAPELPPLVTETMGDLYLRQGFRSEAAEVYRSVLGQRPDDAGLRAKLAALEAPPPALSAAALGGESVRTWLRRVASMRVGAPVAAAAGEATAGPSPLEEAFAAPEAAPEPAGEPTHQAGEAFTLDAIFGRPSGASLVPPPEAAPPASAPGTSFDEFFGAPSEQASVRPDAGAPPPAPATDDDIGSFNTWLRGLKR